MTQDELMFFQPMPAMLPVYARLREELDRRHPDITAKVGRTQISLRNRYVFAAASLPWRRGKGWPAEYLLLTFGLAQRRQSPRIAAATEPYPNRWTHHVLLTRREDVDAQVLEWVEEAYQFALVK